MHSRKEGLSLAKRTRSCPPPGSAGIPEERDMLQMHRKICPACQADTEGRDKAWSDLTQGLKRVLDVPALVFETPESGQIRTAAAEGVWRGPYHYNPPLVVVLEVVNAVADEVRVAQTYLDSVMAGPGDLIIPKGVPPFDDGFIESWNTYTLRGSGLGPVLGRLDEGKVDAIRGMVRDPSASPPWAPLARPFESGDPRSTFRELEVETAYTFASRAVQELLDLTEAYTAPERLGPVAVQQAVRIRFPGSTWRRTPWTGEHAAALTRFPDEALPLAADDTDRVAWPVTMITLSEGRIAGVDIATCHVIDEIRIAEGLEMSGQVHGLPAMVLPSEVVLLLETHEGDVIEPESVDWEEKTGLFFARFPVTERGTARLAVAVIMEAGEEDHG